jgi:hypothetical protein
VKETDFSSTRTGQANLAEEFGKALQRHIGKDKSWPGHPDQSI